MLCIKIQRIISVYMDNLTYFSLYSCRAYNFLPSTHLNSFCTIWWLNTLYAPTRELCAKSILNQLTSNHKTKGKESALTFVQRYHDDGDEFVMKRGLHTLLQKPSSNQYIGVTVDLPARRNSSWLRRRGKWCAWCSGTDGALSSSTSRPEMRRSMLSVTAKHCRTCVGQFRTSGAGCFVPGLSCCTITLGHTRLGGQHIYRSSAGRCLIIHPMPGCHSRDSNTFFERTVKFRPYILYIFGTFNRLRRLLKGCHLFPLHPVYFWSFQPFSTTVKRMPLISLPPCILLVLSTVPDDC